MVRDVQIDTLKQKLLQIEKNIEDENGRAKLNRMPARYFMFFFLIGGEEESQSILERKVKALLRNPDACQFMNITSPGEDAGYGAEAEKILRTAADNRVDVQDLNTIFLCPVIFANNKIGDRIIPILKDIDSYMNQSGHESIWQPTVIINKNVSEYKNIYLTISQIKQFITGMPEGKVNRCCLLSNLDENGFVVPKENIMQTVAMTVVLQNVITDNAGDSQTIRTKVSRSSTAEDGQHLFFTARNAAVTNPTRSLLLQRMCSAIDYFSQKNDANNAMARIDYSFVAQIMDQYMTNLPQHGGAITLFPLYSVMSDSYLHAKLEKIIKEKYYEPLYGDQIRNSQIAKAKAMLLERYFAADGSLSELRTLINDKKLEVEFMQHKQACYSNKRIVYPDTSNKKLFEFKTGEYEMARDYCEKLIRNSGWELLAAVEKQLSQPDMIKAIDASQELLELVKSCIQTRLRQLKDVETVLVVEQNESRTGFDDVQNKWFADAVLNNPKEYEAFNKKFDFIIYSLLQNNIDNCGEILQICYDAIKHSAFSNEAYLGKISDECMINEERAQEFIAVVEKSWCYTLRFLNQDETKDATCIIGDSKNCFCGKLRDKFSGSLFDFKNFDRIDVLHISGAFSPENILEWKQIESVGGGAQNESN